MKITFLMASDDLTGGVRVVATYARELIAQGHEVLAVVAAPLPAGGRRERLARWASAALPPWVGQTLLPTRTRANVVAPAPPGHLQLMGIPLRRLHRPGPPTARDVPDADAIVATWWETALWMHRLPAAKGKRMHLIQGHEVWLGRTAEVHAALRLPNAKVVISEALKTTLQDALGPQSPPFTVIPNAIDPLQFNAPPRRRSATPTVGFVYSVSHIKGVDICTAACAQVRQTFPDLRVLSFGAKPPTDSATLPPGTQFHLRPEPSLLPELYAACDVWLFASRLDSFGLPMLEAMACRTPLVAVPMGAAEQLLTHGGGRLVPPESPQAMAEAVCDLLQMPEAQWQACSDQAWQRAHRHTWQDATAALLDCLKTESLSV